MRCLCIVILLGFSMPVLGSNEVPKEAIELRSRGITELENEQRKRQQNSLPPSPGSCRTNLRDTPTWRSLTFACGSIQRQRHRSQSLSISNPTTSISQLPNARYFTGTDSACGTGANRSAWPAWCRRSLSKYPMPPASCHIGGIERGVLRAT